MREIFAFTCVSPPPFVTFPLRKDWAAKSSCEYPGWTLQKAVKEVDDEIYGRALEEFGRGAREARDETVQPQGVCLSSGRFARCCASVFRRRRSGSGSQTLAPPATLRGPPRGMLVANGRAIGKRPTRAAGAKATGADEQARHV